MTTDHHLPLPLDQMAKLELAVGQVYVFARQEFPTGLIINEAGVLLSTDGPTADYQRIDLELDASIRLMERPGEVRPITELEYRRFERWCSSPVAAQPLGLEVFGVKVGEPAVEDTQVWTSGSGLTLEQLQRAIHEISIEESRPVDHSRSDAVRARIPAGFWEHAPREDQMFVAVVLESIDTIIVHPRDSRQIGAELERIFATTYE